MEGTSHDPALPEPPTPIAPIPSFTNELLLARSHLEKAFQYLLIAVYLPAIAGALSVLNFLSYWKSHVGLCDITRYCNDLLGAPSILSPLTLAFILAACFSIDHYLSISPGFNPQKGSTATPRDDRDNYSGAQPATGAESRPIWNAQEGRIKTNAGRVLRILAIISYVLAASWTVASLAAVTEAGLVLKFDASFYSNGVKTDSQDRVFFGFAAGAANAILALPIGWAAIAISRAGRSKVLAVAADSCHGPPVAEGTEETVGAGGPRSGLRVLSHRSTLEKAVLCLLISLVLSFISGTLSLVYDPFSHLRHINSSPYSFLCLFTSFFIWLLTLVFHRYRSNGVSPGTAVSAFMSFVFIVMATVWLLASGTYLFLCVGALFCDERAPLPHNSPCAYVRKSRIWTGFAACAFGYLQAYTLGCIALLSWQSRGAIRLAGDEDGGNAVAAQNDL